MANLPDAWVEDARNLDNAEQLLHSAHGILLETPAIADFLRNETNKRIVVAQGLRQDLSFEIQEDSTTAQFRKFVVLARKPAGRRDDFRQSELVASRRPT